MCCSSQFFPCLPALGSFKDEVKYWVILKKNHVSSSFMISLCIFLITGPCWIDLGRFYFFIIKNYIHMQPFVMRKADSYQPQWLGEKWCVAWQEGQCIVGHVTTLLYLPDYFVSTEIFLAHIDTLSNKKTVTLFLPLWINHLQTYNWLISPLALCHSCD